MVEKLQRISHSLWFDIAVAAVILVMAVNLGVGLSCPEYAGITDYGGPLFLTVGGHS